MANGWNGPDPTGFSDGGTSHYELGTKYTAVSDVTISHVRVWAPVAGASRANRAGKIWSNAGVQLATAAMPDTLTSGWTDHALNAPVELSAGQSVIVSYDTTDTYGAVLAGFAYPLASADGNVTAIERRLGDGLPDLFPPSGAGNTFYGIDIVYTEGLSGNERPEVGLTAVTAGLVASATLTIDDEDPNTVGYAIEWGDGQSSTGLSSLGPHNHTYAAAGTYAIMVTATDNGGLTDSAAVAVTVAGTPSAGLNFFGIMSTIANHHLKLGLFGAVQKRQAMNAPGSKLVAELWPQWIGPADSGLASTSVGMLVMSRIRTNADAMPTDAVDPEIVRAVDRVLNALTGDITLGGLVRCIDLLGLEGSAVPGGNLHAEAGYLEQDGKIHRVMDIFIPVILNDVWEQAL